MIRFLDLAKINHQYEKELKNAAAGVIDSGWYILGEKVKEFENKYAEYIGVKHAIGVASGLDALRLILRAYIESNVMSEGDEVIVPANTYVATILAITENRLKPVLVEPDINTYNLDFSLIEQYITKRTRAIIVVHLYGRACWSEKLMEIADKYELKIIEDNAQVAGAMVMAQGVGHRAQGKKREESVERGAMSGEMGEISDEQQKLRLTTHNSQLTTIYKRTGSLGHAAGHSFYPTKNLGALGDGGAVTTDDDQLAEVIRVLANYGSSKKGLNTKKGVNSRLDEIQAAFLSVKLKYLDAENQRRRGIAHYYLENICHSFIILPTMNCSEHKTQSTEHRAQSSGRNASTSNALRSAPCALSLDHVWHLFVIRHPERDKLQKHLYNKGIETQIHYSVPPHKQKAFSEWKDRKFPVTEEIHKTVLSLPISPVMPDDEVREVVKAINEY